MSNQSKQQNSKQQNNVSDQNDIELLQYLEDGCDIFLCNIHDFKKIKIENSFIQFVHNFNVSIFNKSTQIVNYNPIYLSHFYKEIPPLFNLTFIASQINFYTQNRNFSLASLKGFSEGDKENGFVPIVLTERPVNGPLSSFFEGSDSLNSEQKYLMICGIVHGMTFIHENGFIHLNLNPTTVYIDENNFTSICDYIFIPPFKITKVKNENTHEESFKFSDITTPLTKFYQNPIYTAPEILKGDEFDQLSDVYSLGLMIFYILFEKNATMKNGKITNYPCDLSIIWKDLIDSCVVSNPKNRPNSLMILRKLIDSKNKESFISSIDPIPVKTKISLKAKNYLKLIEIDIQNKFKSNPVKFDIVDTMLFNINDIDLETRLIIYGAENGDIDCIEDVADFFSSGKNNFNKDKHFSYLCYEQGANKGSVKSLMNIAFRCAQGTGTVKDLKKSYSLYKKALDLASPNDQTIKSKMKFVDDEIKSIKLINIPLNVPDSEIYQLFAGYSKKKIEFQKKPQENLQQIKITFETEYDLNRTIKDISEKKIIINGNPIEFKLLVNEIYESNPFESLISFLPKINFDNYYEGKEKHYYNILTEDSLSATYLTYDKSNEQSFAAKIFCKISGEELIKSFKREVMITSNINHPSIIKYASYNEFNLLNKNDHSPTLFMNFIPKCNLKNVIEMQPTWWKNTAKLKVIIGIASGLYQMFLCNVSHYNLSTDSILLNENFEPVICNFGFLNKYLNDGQDKVKPRSEKIVIMAPELFIKEKYSNYNFEINSYSFGILLYQILTNKSINNVYSSYDVKTIIRDKFNNYVPELPDDMNPFFKDLIKRCLNVSYDERPDPISIFNDLIELIKSNNQILPNLDIESINDYIQKLISSIPDMKILQAKKLIHKYYIHSPEINNKINQLQNDLKTNQKFTIVNNKFINLIKNYSILYISTENKIDEIQQFCGSITESKVLIIDHYQKQNSVLNELHFIISFQNTVIVIIKEMLFSFIQYVFNQTNNEDIRICFLHKTKNIFDECVKIKYIEISHEIEFENDVLQISKQLSFAKENICQSKNTWNMILPSISSYILEKSYCKTHIDRIHDFYISKSKKSESKIINDYIELHQIECGFLYEVKLVYLILDEQLAVIKKPITENKETQKNMEQDSSNFYQIDHPFIPKIYGKINGNNHPVFEFINGQSLTKIQSFQFSEKNKYTIIFQLLSIFEYLHSKCCIYQDLKPDNIIIDSNKNIVLINLNRMVKTDNKDNKMMSILSHIFLSPEILSKDTSIQASISNKSDIYSIGQMIYFILFEQIPNNDKKKNLSMFEKGSRIQQLYNICTNKKPEQRPSLKEIINNLCEIVIRKFDYTDIILEHITPQYLTEIGKILLKQNFKKSIQYLTLASDLDYPEAQQQLGMIYFDKKEPSLDLTKFEKGELLGQGDYGEVFAFKNKETNEKIAVKIMYAHFDSYTKKEKIKIMIDLSIAIQLNHSYICNITKFNPYGFSDEENPVIFSEHLPNGSLNDIIESLRTNKEVPGWDDKKRFQNIVRIAKAMSILHSQNILHRNLTTKSILEDENFSPKINNCCFSYDFHSVQSIMRMIKCSPFCPPEVYINNEYTKASDVYSYGLIVYSIMTNKHPYFGCSQYQIFINTVEGRLPELDKSIPEAYKMLIKRCLLKNPNERPTFNEIIKQFFDIRFLIGSIDKHEYWQIIKEQNNDDFNEIIPCPISAIEYLIKEKKDNEDKGGIENKKDHKSKEKIEGEFEKRQKEEMGNKEINEEFDEEEENDDDIDNEDNEEDNKEENSFPSLSKIKTKSLKNLKKLKPIGYGGFATVYKVRNEITNEIYACKIINIEKIKSHQNHPFGNYFEQEIICLSIADFQAIVKFFGWNKSSIINKYQPSIFTEYCQNGNLINMIEKEKESMGKIQELSFTQKLIIIYGIAKAMSFLHSKNIIHRDLKPENVLLNDFLLPKITDFGLAIQIPQQKEENQMSNALGTIGYIAPEIFICNEYSKASDVYAFAFLLYRLLFTKDPYEKLKTPQIIYKIAKIKERPDLENISKIYKINEIFCKLIERCWSDDPKKRPTFDEIVEKLETDPEYITDDVDTVLFKKYLSSFQEKKITFD